MNTGLQDAENFAWKIDMVYNGFAKPEPLKSYETERVPVADTVLKHSGALLAVVKKPWRFILMARLLRFARFLSRSFLRPQVEKDAQLHIKYELSEHCDIFPDTPAWKKVSSS
jgi:2-polyprenyl-6-methoxyphenol hydroxylase-like FAD-dependent oxidoreductase